MPKRGSTSNAAISPARWIVQLEAKIRRDPADLLAHYELAMLLKHEKRYPQMARLLSSLVTREPDLSLAHFLLADAYAGMKKSAAGARSARRGLSILARSLQAEPPAKEPGAIPELSEFKEMYAEDPNLAEVKYYQKRLESDQFNSEEAFLLGLAYKRLGWFLAAVESFKKVIQLKADNDEAWFELGNTYKQVGKLAEAVKAYQRAIALKPDVAESHFQLGLALVKAGQTGKARGEYQHLARLGSELAEQLKAEIEGR